MAESLRVMTDEERLTDAEARADNSAYFAEQVDEMVQSASDVEAIRSGLTDLYRRFGVPEDEIGDMVEKSVGSKSLEEIQSAVREAAQRDLQNAPVTPRIRDTQNEESLASNPALALLQEQYEALSGADRTYKGKLRTWDEVVKAIPDMPDFLSGVESLEQAQVYFLNEKGQLVVGDGCAEPLEETLGWNYHKSRSEATRISYVDTNGKTVVVKGDDTEIPRDARVLSERGLIDLDSEYKRVNKGQYEAEQVIWTESGKNLSLARSVYWDGGYVRSGVYCPDDEIENRGSRRVLRVNLNFES